MKKSHVFVLILSGWFAAAAAPNDVRDLPLMSGGEPRAFFFHWPEMFGEGGKVPFEQWERTFLRLDGIMGKAVDEEVAGMTARNLAWFTRFKREHPRQALLLHFDGDQRDPRWECGEFFAGHWLYFAGCRVTGDVAAQAGEATIAVENPRLFHVNVGRFGDKNDELAICVLGADGKPDWHQSEQLELLAVDAKSRTLRVRRGAFGTAPQAFAAGKTYIAAHVSGGPWLPTGNLLWLYNFSTACPRDARGRNCADVLVDDLGRRFQPGGALASFDGLEFDVLYFQPEGAGRRRMPEVDSDGDGKGDGGVINGLNAYGIGVYEFCRKLRKRLGDDKLIMADGQTLADFIRPEDYQRSFGLLNGMESEGFPGNYDWGMADWSGGLNRFNFWRQNARTPAFNYINYKYVVPRRSAKEQMKAPAVPLSTARLAMAAAAITDSAFACCLLPPKAPGEVLGVYDELWMGTAHRINWLGKPIAAPLRLGLRAPDLLGGKFADKLRSDGATLQRGNGGGVKVLGAAGATNLCITLTNLQLPAGDLLVKLQLKADPMRGYPAAIARVGWLGWTPRGEPPPRDRIQFTPTRVMTWANSQWFEAVFYFRNLGPATVDLTLHVESGEPVYISDLTAHAAADAIIRDYDHGVVLANPSMRAYAFDVATLFPNVKLRRLQGSAEQDPQTNNGAAVGALVTVGPRDALFLVKDTAAPSPAVNTRRDEQKLHFAIRELPAVLELPGRGQRDDESARFARACAMLENRLQIPAGSLHKDLPAFADTLLKSADTPALERGGALFATREYAEAETAALRIASAGPDGAKALELAGRCAAQLGQLDRALKHYRAAAGLVDEQRDPLQWAGVQRDIAIVLMATGQFGDAETLWRRILDIHQKNLKPQHPDVIGAHNVLANTFFREGKFAEAAAQYREVLTVLEKLRGPDHPDTVRVRQNLERVLKAQAAKK